LPDGVPASACRPVNVIPLDAKVLTGKAQPRTREEHEAFLLAAFDPEDVFDFSNPEDKAEFIGSIGGPK
jgi:hypothetical protein